MVKFGNKCSRETRKDCAVLRWVASWIVGPLDPSDAVDHIHIRFCYVIQSVLEPWDEANMGHMGQQTR